MMKGFIIETFDGIYLDTVFYRSGTSTDDVRKDLIEHDGYPDNIIVTSQHRQQHQY